IWFFLGMLKESPLWTDYGWLVISAMYFGVYFYQRKYSYFTLGNDTIQIHGLFGKKLPLHEIKRIKKFAGDYILKTEKKELKINTQLIVPHSLKELDDALKKLDVEWE
ncbi:MAG TPA: hypothetical protein VFF15_05555, partial [Flavobacteriaceae bacterium]|nr:hypothetical protein [Flavobacteriaceae bacterium]